jgi:hypothetical protein
MRIFTALHQTITMEQAIHNMLKPKVQCYNENRNLKYSNMNDRYCPSHYYPAGLRERSDARVEQSLARGSDSAAVASLLVGRRVQVVRLDSPISEHGHRSRRCRLHCGW